ncbi:MAG: succinate dehydrogenase [Rhodospirillaceae bacterium]|nr:succinate dehydrogenase [Rhodospirillaceae bacterium]|tara:strand:- start:598 stop:939 length:342 start_codon:yes stop_codon:yes gene_type:complete
MIQRWRRHPGYWAAIAHRLSGLVLALFLPAHFLVLGLALEGEIVLESAIRWADQPLVKFSEWALIVLLTLHLSLGLRILILEFLPWRGSRQALIGFGALVSILAGSVFLLKLE